MTQLKVKLTSISDVQKFVNVVASYDGEVDLQSGRYVVNAKSIMGIFSLDLMQPVDMTIHGSNEAALIEQIKDYIVE